MAGTDRCLFCEAMEAHRKVDAFMKETKSNMKHRYSVAIVTRSFMKGQRGVRSTNTDYRYRGCGYDLNFCPECGRKLGEK